MGGGATAAGALDAVSAPGVVVWVGKPPGGMKDCASAAAIAIVNASAVLSDACN